LVYIVYFACWQYLTLRVKNSLGIFGRPVVSEERRGFILGPEADPEDAGQERREILLGHEVRY
jgi:hypothetical protein